MSARTARRTSLHIDWTRCDGHGTCADLLPEVLGRDDWGFPLLREAAAINAENRKRAELAVEHCPMLALKLVRA